MRASDFIITNHDKLDNLLVKLCELVISKQKDDPKKYGVVAAGVLDVDNKFVLGVNTADKGNLRKHAERVAMESYIKKYGEIPEGSIIITTCSPCNEYDSEMASKRYGESCTDLINNSKVRKVYCGYMDPSQNEEHNKYTLEVTDNSDIENLCKRFADTFLSDEDEK